MSLREKDPEVLGPPFSASSLCGGLGCSSDFDQHSDLVDHWDVGKDFKCFFLWEKTFLSRCGAVGQYLLSTDRGHLGKLARSLGKLLYLSSLSFPVCEMGYSETICHRIVVSIRRGEP